MRGVPDGAESDDADPETLDEIPYVDGTLDLGEAAAEQLALALDPFRARRARFCRTCRTKSQALPFNTLASLRRGTDGFRSRQRQRQRGTT